MINRVNFPNFMKIFSLFYQKKGCKSKNNFSITKPEVYYTHKWLRYMHAKCYASIFNRICTITFLRVRIEQKLRESKNANKDKVKGKFAC